MENKHDQKTSIRTRSGQSKYGIQAQAYRYITNLSQIRNNAKLTWNKPIEAYKCKVMGK